MEKWTPADRAKADAIAKAVRTQFRGTTQPQLREIYDGVKELPHVAIERAIAMHARERGVKCTQPEPGRLVVLATHCAQDPTPSGARPRQRIVDYLRRRNPAPLSNFDYLAKHFRECWAMIQAQQTSPRVIQIARNAIYGDGVKALREIGLPDNEARAQARIWVGLSPDEPVTVAESAPMDKNTALAALNRI